MTVFLCVFQHQRPWCLEMAAVCLFLLWRQPVQMHRPLGLKVWCLNYGICSLKTEYRHSELQYLLTEDRNTDWFWVTISAHWRQNMNRFWVTVSAHWRQKYRQILNYDTAHWRQNIEILSYSICSVKTECRQILSYSIYSLETELKDTDGKFQLYSLKTDSVWF